MARDSVVFVVTPCLNWVWMVRFLFAVHSWPWTETWFQHKWNVDVGLRRKLVHSGLHQHRRFKKNSEGWCVKSKNKAEAGKCRIQHMHVEYNRSGSRAGHTVGCTAGLWWFVFERMLLCLFRVAWKSWGIRVHWYFDWILCSRPHSCGWGHRIRESKRLRSLASCFGWVKKAKCR